jgi:uncharacterized membrane protein YraQ (UPF0718 family)/copper chaperone CopZ
MDTLLMTPLLEMVCHPTVGGFAARFWDVLTQMAPYLLFGFLVAGLLSVFLSPEAVERHLGGRGMGPVVKAAAFGVPLPLCSCGVIPVTASLRRHGASPGATTAFLLSTPQTGVDSILVTLSLLGPVYAIFRPLAALITGVVGGALVLLFGTRNGEAAAPEPCQAACCSGEPHGGRLRRALAYGFVDLPRDIGKSLLVGLLLAGLISVLIPEDWFARQVGRGIVPMLLMMAAGIPVYVCATASVPIAAALIGAGVSPGAAFVFLVTGPATNAAALATVWRVLGRRATIIILITIAICALAFGFLLDYLFELVPTVHPAPMDGMMPAWLRVGSTVVLLLVLGGAFVPRRRVREAVEPAGAGEEQTLRIEGMTCSHCVATVRRALMECPGVASADVELKPGSAVVRGSGLDAAALRQAVEAVGYRVAE